MGRRRQEAASIGEGGGKRRPRFHLCLGSLSQVRCSGRGKWLSSLPLPPTPHPSLPGGRAGSAGHSELGHRLRAVRLSAGARLGPGKSSGELPRLLCALGEKLRPGTWDARLAGPRAGGAVRSQGAQPRWERDWRGLCPKVGLTVTSGLSIWGKEPRIQGRVAEIGTRRRTERRVARGAQGGTNRETPGPPGHLGSSFRAKERVVAGRGVQGSGAPGGAREWGIGPDRQSGSSRGWGPSRASGVSRPGGAAAGLFLLGGICRMCS